MVKFQSAGPEKSSRLILKIQWMERKKNIEIDRFPIKILILNRKENVEIVKTEEQRTSETIRLNIGNQENGKVECYIKKNF